MDKILINNRDTIFTIDTYQEFTMDNAIDSAIERYNEEHNTSYDYDNFKWIFKNKSYLKALANASIDIIKSYLINDEVIKDIKYLKASAPKYSNYTTDSYSAKWSYDLNKLIDYIEANRSSFNDYFLDQWSYRIKDDVSIKDYLANCFTDDTPIIDRYDKSDLSKDDFITAMIDFYTRSIYGYDEDYASSERYYYEMIERVDDNEYFSFKLDRSSIKAIDW